MTWMAKRCAVRFPSEIPRANATNGQPIAADIPSVKDLKLTSRAEERAGDPPLPPPLRTETVLKRDDWMLMDPTTPLVPETRASRPMGSNDEDMADGYGEPSQNARTTSGAVDFFASLGTDVVKKKKPEPDRPNPDQVRSRRSG